MATVDCARALADARQLGIPFFLYYLHQALQAVKQVKILH